MLNTQAGKYKVIASPGMAKKVFEFYKQMKSV